MRLPLALFVLALNGCSLATTATATAAPRGSDWERPSWSDLLERVFRVDGFACPGCGGPLALRCVVLNPRATRRILDGLRRATGPRGA